MFFRKENGVNTEPHSGVLVGTWTYRSFLNNPDLSADFNSLEFGRGNIRIDPAPMNHSKARSSTPDGRWS